MTHSNILIRVISFKIDVENVV